MFEENRCKACATDEIVSKCLACRDTGLHIFRNSWKLEILVDDKKRELRELLQWKSQNDPYIQEQEKIVRALEKVVRIMKKLRTKSYEVGDQEEEFLKKHEKKVNKKKCPNCVDGVKYKKIF